MSDRCPHCDAPREPTAVACSGCGAPFATVASDPQMATKVLMLLVVAGLIVVAFFLLRETTLL